MRTLRRRLRATGIGLLFVAGLSMGVLACESKQAEDHAGRGVIAAIDATAREVTLDHGDIPGLMKGMTMTFQVAPEVEIEGLRAGSEVDFRVREEGGVYTVTEIR